MAIERWRPFGTLVERWDPAREMSDIQREMNRLFDGFFGRPLTAQTVERQWMPAMDVHETKDDLVVALEVPGVEEKDVDVSITGDVLTVRGERRPRPELKDERLHWMESVHGKFERMVTLPVRVQTDKVRATYHAGILEIRLPKAEEVKPKQVKINID